MIIIPAIDIKDGKCVRLRQGRMSDATIFNESPSDQAKKWEDLGASRIHVVDLDGSINGLPVNLNKIQAIASSVRVPVQLGGGIRDEQTISHYLEVGIQTVILGTIAAKKPDLTISLLETFSGSIAIGIDAKAGNLAVQGWTEMTEISATDLAKKFDSYYPAAFIYTDIERDGMMRGPNTNSTKEFARAVSSPVILSGGVTQMSDLRPIIGLKEFGVTGIIIGRALYEGTIDLMEAIEMVEHAG